ncbi:MAG: hypothetical protein NZ928_01250, partial [Endomicrobia bacterium]|nr:hypothetical protein [Endomicrobiia bacterium]
MKKSCRFRPCVGSILEYKIFSIRIRLIKIIRKLILAVIFFEILSFWVFADKLGNLEVAGGVYG